MKRYRASLQKTIYKYRQGKFLPSTKLKEKVVFVEAKDSADARDIVETAFPDWQISMFWNVWPDKGSR